MKHKRLFIIVTDFNGYEQTFRCLKNLRQSLYQKFVILVVDHGTTRDTFLRLKKDFPEVIRIAGSSTLWWTGATNLGIQHALKLGADRIMLLNNDCYVTPKAIGTLMCLSCAHPKAIIAPIQRDWRTDSITSISPRGCFLLGFPTVPGPKRLTPAMASRELLPVRLICGGRGVILPAAVFASLGLFDADALPHYGADHDFYLRARRLGVPLCVATRALVDIDDNHTSLAERPETLRVEEFVATLRITRSHRNLRDIATLFRKHYPIPGFSWLGISLYIGRYSIVYLVKRGRFLLFSKHAQRG